MKYIRLVFFVLFTPMAVLAQPYLSNLNVKDGDPIYSTYAAALQRSEYIVNEAYHFIWTDSEKGMSFEAKQAGELAPAFVLGNQVVSRLKEFFQPPVITASYSDMVRFYYYPFRDIKVENFFICYSSRIMVYDLTITNERKSPVELGIIPILKHVNAYTGLEALPDRSGLTFFHQEKPDGWMKENKIPFQESLRNILLVSGTIDGYGTYTGFESRRDTTTVYFMNDAKRANLNGNLPAEGSKMLAMKQSLQIPAGGTVTIRIIRGVIEGEKDVNELLTSARPLLTSDLSIYQKENEKLYSAIPKVNFPDPAYEAVYWNAFSLMRQCMLPPENESSYNFYVFSREPRWGWGYGGQVFHESLVMLAYAYMDPMSAMNSQRVFMERQWESGYINYRTGPYLNESIPENGQYTSSAPWFNYQNLEIYKITKDNAFLKEAYQSGKKFYTYFVSNRDSDNDGLCEWGANAVLECVRDARVAVWDEVGDPVNYEAVDANIMLVSEANSLSEMASILGLQDEAKQWKDDADKRKKLINETFWDPETEFFYQVTKDKHTFSFKKENDLKRKEIIAFLALWANIVDKDRAEKLHKHLTNPNTFFRPFGIPTLAADDPYYNPIGYWNGPIWLPWQYLIFKGLINYGYEKTAVELVHRIMKNVTYQLQTNHWFWEFYSADDYQAGWNKAYIWSGIISRMLYDIDHLPKK